VFNLDSVFCGPFDEVEHTPIAGEIIVAPVVSVSLGGTSWQIHIFVEIGLGQLDLFVI
jgi:hypothetical protein